MAYNGLYRTVAYTTTGTKGSINLDPMIAPFNTTVAVDVGGGGTYKLQYSIDPYTAADGSAIADSAATWFDSVNIPAGTAASAVTAIVSPVSRIRLVIAAVTDTLTVKVSQAMSIN